MAQPYFLFRIDQQLAAIAAVHVGEVLALPELTLLPDAPLGIIGVVDLRGEILPVLDLKLVAADSPRRYQVTDSLLVITHADLKVGVIVSAAQGIRELDPEAIATNLAEHRDLFGPEARDMLAGVVLEDSCLVLKEPQHWLNVSSLQQVVSVTSFLIGKIHGEDSEASLGATFSSEDQIVLRQRAEALRRSLDESEAVEAVEKPSGGEDWGSALWP